MSLQVIRSEIVELWEILVPTRVNNKDVLLAFHHAWDEKVRKISGGLTIYRAAVGQWISPQGKTIRERMIPVRIACNYNQINQIADITAVHYKQDAVMFYLVSEKVQITHYV
jgi:hypothetical protein